jgi:glycosyltransferase involved in cell wall biosynthesis
MNEEASVPTVSVILPAYGVAKYIGAAVESVLQQTYTDYEIIVVNDGDPDTEALEAALEPYAERIVYLKQENRGVCAARNTAIGAARGRYLAFLDSDDLLEPDYLAVQVGILENDPTIDAVYPNALVFGETINAGKTYMDICPSQGEVTFENLVTERCQVSIFVTARKEAVVRAGMFDPNIPISGDFDMWVRMVKHGSRFTYVRRVLARHRCRPDSLSANRAELHVDMSAIFNKAKNYDLSPSEREVLKRECDKNEAMVNLYKGKQAVVDRNFKAAIDYLTRANDFLKSRKLQLVTTALHVAPRLLLRINIMRNWLQPNNAR